LKKYQGFLIDLDGTMYNGTEKIEEAVEFVNQLHKLGLPYLFLTNNSTKYPEDVAETLRSMGVPAEKEQVFTSSMATATYVFNENPDARVFPIGEEGLEGALKSAGLSIAETGVDYVVMGLDREITYEKLTVGTLAIRGGAKFVATNGDLKLPSERGFLPGAGSLISVLATTTGVTPKFVGKPESIIVDQALEVLGTSKEETLMIGDNYATDISAGIRAGIDSLLVFSGVTKEVDLKDVEVQPTYTIDSLKNWPI